MSQNKKRSDKFDEECPTNDFNPGKPNGKCWGDGHYECKNCINYREDFKRLGQDYIDAVHNLQGGLELLNLK